MFSKMFRRMQALANLELVILSKDECGLCNEAIAVAQSLRRKHPFRLRVVKISKGDEWYDAYWDKIPVGLVNGEMIFKYRIAPEELLEKLHARAHR